MTRQIVLDTETTGLEPAEGHRIIEIGCIELTSRRVTGEFHHFLNPERAIDAAALEVHGIRNEDLVNKPRFADIAASLLDYLRGAELIIHNADFDTSFLNAELVRAGFTEKIQDICTVTDTWQMARKLHPGQKNNLNALCQRYSVDNSSRELHGALLDARLLADVYLAMTGGQSALVLEEPGAVAVPAGPSGGDASEQAGPLVVIYAAEPELEAHRERLKAIAKKAGRILWPDDLPAQEGTHVESVV